MELSAKIRKSKGKQNKSLRNKGLIPAVVFGKDLTPTNIQIPSLEFTSIYSQAGESTLIDLKIANKDPLKVLISEVQRNPVSGLPIHANFQKVDLTQKITATVPINFIGSSDVINSGEGILLSLLDGVEVESLPADLPKELQVDISQLKEVGDALQIRNIKVDKSKIEIKAGPEDLICKIDYAEQIEEAEEEITEEEAVQAVEATEELSDEERKSRDAEKAETQKETESTVKEEKVKKE